MIAWSRRNQTNGAYVKAITKITYAAEEPKDYWAERGYSRYDGI
jgi:hypothetical protein